jgi:hypothetical protein
MSRKSGTESQGQGDPLTFTTIKHRSKVAAIWMTSIGLLMVSILTLSSQQTRLAMQNQHQLGSLKDDEFFADHYELPHSLTRDTKGDDKTGGSHKSSGRQRKEKKKRNRSDEKASKASKASKALVVNDNDKDNDNDNDNDNDSKQQYIKRQKIKWHESRPPLKSLITKEGGIQGDVSPLLDFAILGHAKCATSFIMNWLSEHPEIQIFDREVCDLNEGQPSDLVTKLYQELEAGAQYKRGFKCPGHFSRGSFRDLRSYFRHTRIIVGLRHPVEWFSSFYNFRYRHPRGTLVLPEPNELIGECTTEAQGVCTSRAEFHGNLAMLAKTNHSDPDEWKLLRLRDKYQHMSRIDNPVFLYDVNQLYDSNKTRTAALKADLRDFLGVQTDMPDPVGEGKKSSKPKLQKMDICEPQYAALRSELLDIGERASIWITKYFMAASSDQVVVSSPDFFKEILQDWKVDPCVVKEV